MWRKRVKADQRWADAIIEAVATFEQVAEQMVATYTERTAGLPLTERIDYFPEARAAF
jgi:predicted Zn-dependent protease